MPQFPDVDPIPVPAPLWLLKVLHNLTLSLHLTAMQLLVGGLLLSLMLALIGRSRQSKDMQQASGLIVHRLPTVMAFVINFGIPPLLFAQVLYGRALYTSSVLIGAYWISVIFLLMASYYAIYVSARRADNRQSWIAPGLAAMAIVLTIGFIYSNNMTLMLRPQAWTGMYQTNPTGISLNTADPTLWPRWIFMIAGGLPITGCAMLLLARRSESGSQLRTVLRRWGGLAAVAGIAIQAVAAFLAIGAQPLGVVAGVMHSALYMPFAYGWIATAALLLLIGALHTAADGGALAAFAAGLVAFLNVACTVMVRDGIRDITLKAQGFDVWNRQVVSNWSVIGLFLILFVAALGVVFFLITVLAKARRLEEKYA